MRILIVDDEVVSRTKLEAIMSSTGQCQTAACGSRALDLYERALTEGSGFDLVMLDIDMPDLQGDQVLKRLRKMENNGPHRAAVVMVTAKSEQSHVLTCLTNGCDAYITKPFNAQAIDEKLARLGLVGDHIPCASSTADTSGSKRDAIIQEIQDSIRTGKFKLPALPQIAIQFQELIENNADVLELAQLLKQDMVLALKLVAVANSALWRGFDAVETVEQAIGRLGMTQTEQMVVALSGYQLFKTDNPKDMDIRQSLWQHSLACAYASEMLARSLARDLSVKPFCAGLLHDIGMLALLHIVAQMEECGRYTDAIDDGTLSGIIVSYHAMFGARLLETWKFDGEYSRISLNHNNLHTAEPLTDGLLVVHFGNLVAKSIGYTADGQPFNTDLVKVQSAKALKLNTGQIDLLKQKVSERMAQSAALMN
jgi:HD-like signal output (HDOD) protein/ActR/RegA family two-component response regulator